MIKKAFFEEFDSLTSFMRTVDSRERNKEFADKEQSRTGGEEFTGTKSMEEADKLMAYGWDEGFKKVLEAEAFQGIRGNDGYVNLVRPTSEPVGFIPNIPNAIRNLPNSMINLHKEPRKVKVKRLYIYNNVNCGVGTSEMITAMVKLYRYVFDTELNGIRTEINIMSGFYRDDKLYGFSIKIKDAKEVMNKKKLCYLLAHPSFFRRHGFQWLERCPVPVPSGMSSGYGRSPERREWIEAGVPKAIGFWELNRWSNEELAKELDEQ